MDSGTGRDGHRILAGLDIDLTPVAIIGMLLIWASFASPAKAGALEAAYRAGDIPACETLVDQGVSEIERLLVRSMRVRDPEALLNYMRSITGIAGPGWVRREAAHHLCDHFCLSNIPDSLAHWSARLVELGGSGYECPLNAGPGHTWYVQVGAFSSERNATTALRNLSKAGVAVRVVRRGGHFRALAGSYASKRDARSAGRSWREQGLIDDFRPYELEGE